MKNLKFAPDLVPLILSSSKTSTWRLFDDKNLTAGDTLILINRGNGEQFAKAKITSVKGTIMGSLIDQDKEGHEPFGSDEEMYRTYQKYYSRKVSKNTPVKIIRFRIIQ